jgi:dTDP-4-amino-4,6-dideoxygalactose transaminase
MIRIKTVSKNWGAPQMFDIPITRPSIRQDDIERVVEVLRSGQLVQGKYLQKLENLVADYVGVSHAIAVSSGTAALHLALLSLGIGPGDEVIVPAFSYIATANVVELVGAKPVFVDICLESFDLDVTLLEQAITKNTKAIMPVHEFGFPAEMGSILKIAEKYDIRVIEDAACALGAEWRGRKVGGIGNIGAFSLHPRKAATSGEGGILTTNSDESAAFIRMMRNHGIDSTKGAPEFVAAGFNYRMTDFQAALVLGQIERIDETIERRAGIANRYDIDLDGRFLIKPSRPAEGKASWQSYHVVLDDDLDRQAFFNYLQQRRIGAKLGAQCIPVQRYYQTKYGYRSALFPMAVRAFRHGVVIPLYEGMSDTETTEVIDAVNSFFRSIHGHQ